MSLPRYVFIEEFVVVQNGFQTMTIVEKFSVPSTTPSWAVFEKSWDSVPNVSVGNLCFTRILTLKRFLCYSLTTV